MGELHERLSAIEKKVNDFAKVVDIEVKEQQIARLESRMAEGDFWTDQIRAQKQVAELKSIKSIVEPWRTMANTRFRWPRPSNPM